MEKVEAGKIAVQLMRGPKSRLAHYHHRCCHTCNHVYWLLTVHWALGLTFMCIVLPNPHDNSIWSPFCKLSSEKLHNFSKEVCLANVRASVWLGACRCNHSAIPYWLHTVYVYVGANTYLRIHILQIGAWRTFYSEPVVIVNCHHEPLSYQNQTHSLSLFSAYRMSIPFSIIVANHGAPILPARN